ncbi:MAG: DHH family phosphoesterase [Gammaproteobacteria bacterium]|nr:DHH family phosphoesterase [Gammaproteobacteria bacterium]
MSQELAIIYKEILHEIDQAAHVMVVMHQQPDGDAAGACLALAHYMDTIEKPHTCFSVDGISPTYRFLPGINKIKSDENHWHPEKVLFDLLIVVDAGDLRYAGITDYIDRLVHDFKIINIDHHATNEHYGDHNLVITTASSTCEIIHDLLHSIDVINRDMASCLMTGLITDTTGFTNLATTSSAIETAGKLLLKGANMKHIADHTLQNRSYTTLKLWGRALERLTPSKNGIVITFITQQDITECGADREAVEGVSNYLNSLDDRTDAKISLLLSEREPGIIKGSLRTTHPLIDVSKLAKILGGGGHKKAAGFSIRGKIKKHGDRFVIEPIKA